MHPERHDLVRERLGLRQCLLRLPEHALRSVEVCGLGGRHDHHDHIDHNDRSVRSMRAELHRTDRHMRLAKLDLLRVRATATRQLIEHLLWLPDLRADHLSEREAHHCVRALTKHTHTRGLLWDSVVHRNKHVHG